MFDWNIFTTGNMLLWTLGAAGVYFMNLHRMIPIKMIKNLNKMQATVATLLIGLFLTGGISALTGGAAAAGTYGAQSSIYAPTKITDVQVTTSPTGSGGYCTSVGEDATADNRLYMRCKNNQSEVTGDLSSIIFTVYRQGARAETCPVKCTSPTFKSELDSSDTNVHHLLNRNTKDEHYCYVKSGGAAGTSDPKESTVLGFTEGAASTTLGMQIDLDASAIGNLDNYTTKVITLDICGYNYYVDVTTLS